MDANQDGIVDRSEWNEYHLEEQEETRNNSLQRRNLLTQAKQAMASGDLAGARRLLEEIGGAGAWSQEGAEAAARRMPRNATHIKAGMWLDGEGEAIPRVLELVDERGIPATRWQFFHVHEATLLIHPSLPAFLSPLLPAALPSGWSGQPTDSMLRPAFCAESAPNLVRHGPCRPPRVGPNRRHSENSSRSWREVDRYYEAA